MADGLSAYGLPAPGLQPTQFTAPANYTANGPVPTFTGPSLPAPVDYAPTQAPPSSSGAPDIGPASHPPPFMAVLGDAEKNLGHTLSQQEFDQLATDYKTNYAVPALNAQFKGKKQNVDAEVAAFDNQVQHLRNQRYAAQDEQKKGSAIGDFLKSTGQQFGAAVGPGTVAYGSRILGGLTSLEGYAPNAVSDFFNNQAAPGTNGVPEAVANAPNAQAGGQEFAKIILGNNYGNAGFATLRQKLEAQGAQMYQSRIPSAGRLEDQWSQQAEQRSPLGATAGNVAALLSIFLGNEAGISRAARLPELAADAGRLAKVGRLLPAAALTANRTATDTAANNAERGDNISDIMKQIAADQTLGTAFNLLPANAPGGLITRALTGAGIGAAQQATQSTVDKAINENNTAPTAQDYLTNAGFSAALAAILGGRGGGNKLKRQPEPTPTPADTTNAQPAAAPAAPAASAPAAETATAPATFNETVNNPGDGVETTQLVKLQATLLEKANAQTKKYKTEIAAATTPETVVTGATALARRFAGKQWDSLNTEQRTQSIETLAAWLGKKNKVDTDQIATHLQSLQQAPVETPTAQGATPAVTEQPLPAEITGQQVPDTTPQEAANAAKDLANLKNMGKGISDSFYDGFWDSLTGGPKASSAFQNEPTFAMLKGAVDAGKITSRDQLKQVLTQAAERSATRKSNALRKPAEAPAEPAPTAQEQAAAANPTNPADNHEAVANTVADALADNSTVETQRNKLKATAKKITEGQYNQAYLRALANRDSAPADAAEAQIRQDGNFQAASEAMRRGEITSADDVGKFLKANKGESTVGDGIAGNEGKQVGALLSSRSNKADMVAARKAVRTTVLEPLMKLGEDRATIEKMTVGDAVNHLQNLASTFTSDESRAATPKKTLKKANVEPVENPDEPPPTKPTTKKKPLKKANVEPVEKPKSAPKGKTNGPKAEAPADEAGAATPLEAQLNSRFQELPQNVIDDIHDAVARARAGDKEDLTDIISGYQESGDISKEDAKWLREQAKKPATIINFDLHENNASGESSASLEAQHRLADEKAAGQTRAIIRRDGSVEPLTGVDAVDTHARAGEIIVQRGIGKKDWTILSQGDDVSKSIAEGRINKYREDLNGVHDEARRAPEDVAEKSGEHTLNLDEFEDFQLDRNKNEKDTLRAPDRITTIQTTRRVNKILEGIVTKDHDVREVGAELTKLRDQLEDRAMERKMKAAFRERRRGPEWVRAQLQRMVADYPEGSNHYEAGKMALWLLNTSPHLADDLAFSLRENIPGAGYFNPLSRLIGINSTDTNPTTGVHELLHASERLMPKEVQDKLRAEYIGRIQNKIKQVAKGTTPTDRTAAIRRAYLETAIKNFAQPSNGNREMMMQLLTKYRKEIPANEYYKYFDSSEYWANEASDILNRRYEAGSWIDKAKNWLGEFAQHIKSFFGWDSNSRVLKTLDQVLKGTGENPKSNQLAEGNTIQKDISRQQEGDDPSDEQLGYESAKDANEDPNMVKSVPKGNGSTNLGKVNTAQHFVEQSMKADYGLEKAMQALRKMGVKIDENNNVEDAAYAKNGLVSEYNSKDFDEAFNPVSDWAYKNMSKHAKNMTEFTDKLNKFFQNTHFLERAKTDWILESPLKGEAGYDRADILEQVSKGEIKPADAKKQLEQLATKNAQYSWEDWAKQNEVPIESMQTQLAKLDSESGINQKSMAELNKLMDGARDRTTQRLVEAGLVDKNDPWKEVYGWKWYVPLKGSAYGGKADNNFDLIPTKRIALGRLNAQMNVMDGRNSFAERPFSRLFVDMARAGERQANGQLLDRVYNLAVDHGKEIGATIETFTGRPKDGYTNTKTGEEVDRLKAPASGIIVNDGDTHYVITLPKDSQLLRGLVQMNNVERPNAFEKQISKGTNVLARLYTTVHPGWQTFSGFIRDLTYIPVTLGASKFSNPLEAVPLWAKYSGNVLQAYKALPTLIPHLLGQSNKLRQMGETDPNSWAGWTRRYEASGGANQFTKGFDVAGTEQLLKARLQDVDGIADASKFAWNKVLEYTGNYANFLEGIGRVAMFKTLVEGGTSERDAAVQVRKLLDYSQSGLKGRRINSWLAFFRVGMTGADAMRRAFTKPTGGLDYVKMAKWQGFMGALGSIGYMAASAMLGQDENGKDVIGKVDPGQLTQKILFPLGDKVAGVNLGLGLPQVLMAPGILAAAVASGNVTQEQALKAYADTLARNGPITPAGTKGSTPTDFAASYVLGFTPTVVRPLVDVERNTTTFNSSIHTDQDNNKYASDSGRPNTPTEYKDMARWLHDNTGGLVDYHPEDIRYMVQSYGGQWATDFTKLALSNPEQAAGAPDEPNRLAGKLFVDTNHYMQNELYDTLGQLQDSRRRYNSLVARAKDDGQDDKAAKAAADQAVNRDPQFKAELAAFKTLDAARKQYNDKVTQLKNNRLMSDTRKQLVRKQLDSQLRVQIEKAQNSIPTD